MRIAVPRKRLVPVTAEDLRALSDEEVQEVLARLGEETCKELRHTWEFWARDKQLAPEGIWKVWFLNAGRGFGKTRVGAEYIRERIKAGDRRIALVGPTAADVRDTMVLGESGICSVCWEGDKLDNGKLMGPAVHEPSKRRVYWPECGAQAVMFSAEEPERLRGPQFHAAWCDEICAWMKARETWEMLQYCVRLGKDPRVVITTTPKPQKLIKEIMADHRTVITTGSTYDNAANLAADFIDDMKSKEGTRLAQQEIHAQILDEAAGALWNREMLADAELPADWTAPEFLRVVVSVDPAITANKESDETGIIGAALDYDDRGFVLEDQSAQLQPQAWAERAVDMYYRLGADVMVAEKNQGGEMVRHTIHSVDPNINVKLIHASRGKQTRAEPISALYEQRKVFHVRGLNALEDQMVAWEPLSGAKSPDRIDALVHGLTELMLTGRRRPALSIAYESVKGLLARRTQNGR